MDNPDSSTTTVKTTRNYLGKGKVVKLCCVCGDEFSVKPSHAKKRFTCSYQCMHKDPVLKQARRKKLEKKISKLCLMCGELFIVKLGHSSKRITCSRKCRYVYTSSITQGKDNPNYSNAMQRHCIGCGIDYQSYNKKTKYCSVICRARADSIRAQKQYDLLAPSTLADRRRARRRKRQLAQPYTLTGKQWLDIKTHFGFLCVYCGRDDLLLTKDHVLPVLLGGSHTMSNIVPACSSCNSKKGTKSIPFELWAVKKRPLQPEQPSLLFA
jgi:5-methylcytosine-specific restriction endonuclease McrA